ncbi:MAG: DUF1963 domain-containing protein [Kiritimatiellales bacterium]|nr:DUF1963 domain-containing protein [Kiritimatiellales bacterium]MCF7864152.1 DUF1963 domain-containing protein [Kiritimatiellales bacterium]
MKKNIPPFRMVLEPMTEEAKKITPFKWASKEIGKRHLLGGSPDFIQEDKWPTCSECHEKMTFYAQLDSINDEFCIADCGMIYVFVCLECNEVASFIQSN